MANMELPDRFTIATRPSSSGAFYDIVYDEMVFYQKAFQILIRFMTSYCHFFNPTVFLNLSYSRIAIICIL